MHAGSFWIILALEFIPEMGLEHLIATCTNRIMDNLAGKTVIKNQEDTSNATQAKVPDSPNDEIRSQSCGSITRSMTHEMAHLKLQIVLWSPASSWEVAASAPALEV